MQQIFAASLRLICTFASGLWIALAASLLASLATVPLEAQATVRSRSHPPLHSADPWWKHALLYEIYPRSFQDSNGDGVGDLNGITMRMDYLQRLGVDAIWISPMFPSPQVDFGYDVSDYRAVDPQYGTLADMDHLIAEGRKHSVRVMLDMVMNHTSDQHRWFIEAASSRTNPKHDWYVWNDGVPASSPGVTPYQRKYEHEGLVPPNNWVSLFGGSAWEWVPAVHQFFYHKFYKQQPDLNWRNPPVEEAMFGVLRFWLDRGVAGFRLDAIPTLFEDPQLRNEVELGGVNAQGDPNLNDERTNMLPEVHDVQRRMRALVDEYPGDRVLVGETYLPKTDELNNWYGGDKHDELQLPMDTLVGFHSEGGGPSSPNAHLDIAHFRSTLTDMETLLGTNQPLLVFDNHDNPRSWDRFGDGAHNAEIARLIATILLTSRATALTYYGAEIGMKTSVPTRREEVKDPIGITGWPAEKGRDGERTPMQWTPGPQAGFSKNPNTWLPIPADYVTTNVQTEEAQPASTLHWFERLAALRRNNLALRSGTMKMLDPKNPDVLSYLRIAPGGKVVLIVLNFTGESRALSPDLGGHASANPSVQTLFTDAPSLQGVTSLRNIALPPFAVWIGSVN